MIIIITLGWFKKDFIVLVDGQKLFDATEPKCTLLQATYRPTDLRRLTLNRRILGEPLVVDNNDTKITRGCV